MKNKPSSLPTENLLDLVRPEIRALSAYHVPDANGLIKLDAMENPYTLSQDLLEQWAELLKTAELNRYPDPSAAGLQSSLRQQMQVPAHCATVLGNGSDELIQMLALALAAEGRSLLSFDPGFVMYGMIAKFAGINYIGVPLTPSFDIDLQASLAAIEQHRPTLVFIAYPNNPTGNLFNADSIEQIIRAAPGIVVVDEAYHPFAQTSFMPLLEKYDRLMVMRTLSKMGLAGLRLGLLCGNPELVEEINKVRLPYNINVLTQCTAKFMLDNIGFLDGQAELIRADREKMLQRLSMFEQLTVYPSQANFILFRLEQGDATEVFESLRGSGVLIKNLDSPGVLQNCLRVTVGKPEENQLFMEALDRALKR